MTPTMHPQSRPPVKDFEGRGGEAEVDGLMNEPMRDGGVEMVLDRHVVIDVDFGLRHSVYTKRSGGNGRSAG